ncbi:MAG: tubulin-like doman-containing protein [Desulfobaccales bacterium]
MTATMWMILLVTLGIVFLIYLMVGLIALWWGTRTPSVAGLLVRSTNLKIAAPDQRVEVRLQVNAGGLPIGGSSSRHLTFVLLLVDRSGSGSLPQKTQEAAENFIECMAGPTCQIGVIQFDAKAEELCEFTDNKLQLRRALRHIRPGAGTAMDMALYQAQEKFAQARLGQVRLMQSASQATKEVLILFSDGLHDPESAKSAAKALKEDGVRLVTVPLGAQADSALLEELASSKNLCMTTLEPEKLTFLYQELGDTMGENYGSHIFIRERFNHKQFDLVGMGSLEPIRHNVGEGYLEWFMPFLAQKSSYISYQIVPKQKGWYQIAEFSATLEMTDVHGKEFKTSSMAGPYLLVLPRFGYAVSWALLNPVFWWIFHWLVKRRPPLVSGGGDPHKPYTPPPKPDFVVPSLTSKPRPVVSPTLVVGLGGSGAVVLTSLKQTLLEIFDGRMPEMVRLLSIDVAGPEVTHNIGHTGVRLSEENHEIYSLATDLGPLTQAVACAPQDYPQWGWYPAREILATYPELHLVAGTHGDRRLGRAALWQQMDGLARTVQKHLDSFGQGPLDLLVVSAMSGGTGSGIIGDVCALLRQALEQRRIGGVGINLVLLTPQSFFSALGIVTPACRNAAALLRELDRILVNRQVPMTFCTGTQEGPAIQATQIIDRVFVTAGDGGELRHELYPMVADFLLSWMQSPDLRTQFYDLASHETRLLRERGESISCGFGLASLHLPMHTIEEILVCRSLFEMLGKHLLGTVSQEGRFIISLDSLVDAGTKEALKYLYRGSSLSHPRPLYLDNLPGLADCHTFLETLRQISLTGQTPQTIYSQGLAIDQDREKLAVLFGEWCYQVLNGVAPHNATQEDLIAAKRGKLAILAQSLTLFMDDCEKVCLNASREDIRQAAPSLTVASLQRIFKSYYDLADSVKMEVCRWIWLMGDGPPPDALFMTHIPTDVSGLLRLANDEMQERIEHLRFLRGDWGVQYLADEALIMQIFQECFATVSDSLITRFFWKVDSDPGKGCVAIRLHLFGRKEDIFEPKPKSIRQLYERLKEIIRATAKPTTAQSVEKFAPQAAARLYQKCRLPIVDPDVTQKAYQVYFWRPEGNPSAVGELSAMTNVTAIGLQSTDPHRLTLMVTQALQTLGATNQMESVRTESGPWWDLPYIYPEEQAAARFERFLSRKMAIEERLNPSLTPFLHEEQGLKAFMACVFRNRISLGLYNVKNCVALEWQGDIFWLTTEQQATSPDPLILTVMQQFVMRKTDVYDSGKLLPIEAVLQEDFPTLLRDRQEAVKEKIIENLGSLGIPPDDLILRQLLYLLEVFVICIRVQLPPNAGQNI